jgi:hypothetical protein
LVDGSLARDTRVGGKRCRSTFKFSKFKRYFHRQKTILRFSFLFRSTGIFPWTGLVGCGN